MSTFTIDWSHVLMGALIVGLLLALAGVGLALFLVLVKGKGSSDAVKTVESEVVAAAESPAGKTLIGDVEQIAAAVAKRMQAAPPVTIPNHPALTAVADVIQEGSAAKSTLAQVAKLTEAANAAATKSPTS